jgi:hypothetical protein
MSAEFDPLRILRVLAECQVRGVVIGGLAAWLQGAPVVTTDLDLVFDPDPENLRRLVEALGRLGAIYRDPAGRRIEPEVSRLAARTGGGHHLLRTEAGELDLLREAAGFDYAALLPGSVELELEGVRARFATLATVIELKSRAARPKDHAALPMLNAALALEDE